MIECVLYDCDIVKALTMTSNGYLFRLDLSLDLEMLEESLDKLVGPLNIIKEIKPLKSLYSLDTKISPNGTPFQQKVWAVLRTIPFGTTMTYGEIAEMIGDRKAVRAVAGACGKNPISLLIPCHRAVAKYEIGGFHWGVRLKSVLIDFERNNDARIHTPFA